MPRTDVILLIIRLIHKETRRWHVTTSILTRTRLLSAADSLRPPGSYDDVMEMRSFYDSSTDPELIKRCIARL